MLLSLLPSCVEKTNTNPAQFTKLDSLTDDYLSLQDSILESWNNMIKDDNEKLDAMENLIHELKVSRSIDERLFKSYKERIRQLRQSRFNQKTMSNFDVVEEYDFASNSLISELIVLAESQTEFAYNTTLQTLTDKIRTADQRVAVYREEYDLIVSEYNEFLEENKSYLKEIETDSFLEKKPVFQVASDE